ncbi:hypothetical protein BT96DRAFT_1027543 [Gymnopus androsaceus JB14]|uniref:Uncharacterized protein n=1 Tax=Gymnopus androsaceus JB14 TaxID=1447944 RepID=A0A6A4GBG1_9AGAR|nr:hypothetical protein BT96DRAFT_1027543 [Gymnopus androsaceus JB14]
MTSFYAKFYSNSLLASLNGRGPFSPFRKSVPTSTQGDTKTGLYFAVQVTQKSEISSDSTRRSQPTSRSSFAGTEHASRTSASEIQLANILKEYRDFDLNTHTVV